MKTMSQLPVILRRIAIISAVFAVLMSLLITITWFQVQFSDPLNTPALETLNKRLIQEPDNQQLQEDIRHLDLLARKAFFTSQWQIRMGGYLLAASLLLMVISLKWLETITPEVPGIPSGSPVNLWIRQKSRRRWVIAAGLIIVFTVFVMAWLTHRSLNPAIPAAVTERTADPSGVPNIPSTGPEPTVIDSASATTDSIPATTNLVEGFPTQDQIRNNTLNFRGPGGIGVFYHTNIPSTWDGTTGKNIRWKTEIPLPGFNSPITWEEKIFLSGAKEKRKEVYCLDAGSGKILWTADLSALPGSPDQIPKVIAETGQAAPTMATDGRRVYVIFANGDLAALDMAGKIVWSKNMGFPKNHYGHSSSLIMYRDLLIVQYDQSGSARVLALSGKTGDKIWETQRNVKVSWASPALINTGSRTEVILAAEPDMISYDPSNGRELWKIDCISGEVGPSVAFTNGIVFSVNDYSKLAAIRIGDSPSIAWESDEYLPDVPSPVALNNLLFLVTSYGTLVCYDASTGDKHWEHEIGKSVYASPVIADGKLFVMDKTGVMHLFTVSEKLSAIGTASLGESSSCTPVFSNGRIFIRGNKHLFCIGK
jgi:outer membrane protein assembly factor BamB